jgi:hypothetical protein
LAETRNAPRDPAEEYRPPRALQPVSDKKVLALIVNFSRQIDAFNEIASRCQGDNRG